MTTIEHDDAALLANTPEPAPIDLPLPEAEGDMQASASRRPRSVSFRISDHFPQFNNYCGQAAVTSVVEAWGRSGGASQVDLFKQVYERFPPDIVWGLLGTSPNRMIDALGFGGLRTRFHSIPGWLPGGFMNPPNQALWHPYRMQIEQMVQQGFPAIVLVDSGKLPNSPGGGLHWIVWHGIINDMAHFCNGFGGDRYQDDSMPIAQFHEAWEVPVAPSGFPKFAALFGYP